MRSGRSHGALPRSHAHAARRESRRRARADDPDEWQDALDTANSEHGKRPAHYLMAMPLLGDYLEEGLSAFGDGIVDMDEKLEGPSEADNS